MSEQVEETIASTEEENAKKAKEQLDAFLKNPENKKNAARLAFQVQEEVGQEWFGASRLTKLFKVTKEEVKIRLSTLLAFELAVYKNEKGQKLYKIDINHKEQRSILSQEIEFHQQQIKLLNEKIAKLD